MSSQEIPVRGGPSTAEKDQLSKEELLQLLLAAEQRASQAEQRADAPMTRSNAPLAERADDEKQRADDEKQRAQAEQRAGDEKQRADDEKQRASQAEQRADEEKQRADDQAKLTRRTTLPEYIEACHRLVFQQFRVEQDASLTSLGTKTDPRNKICPSRLDVWTDFHEVQRGIYETLHSVWHEEKRVFESETFLRELGDRIYKHRVANERDLEYIQHNVVEDPVKCIFNALQKEDAAKAALNIKEDVSFENHPAAIADSPQPPQTPPARSSDSPSASKIHPDQICVYKHGSEDSSLRTIAYVVEYKAPHKLTLPHLRVGLHPMDIYQDVVNRPTIPTAEDKHGLFKYHAELLTAAAVTQTFHYMIEAGLEYSYLTTGEAIVFLKIDWTTPILLHYHLAEPGPEVDAQPNDLMYCAAVSQVLAFTLLTFRSEKRAQHERQQAMNTLKRWKVDFEAVLRSIPPTNRKAPPESPGYQPITYRHVKRSPYQLRNRRRRRARSTDSSPSMEPLRDPFDDEDSDPGIPDTPTPGLRTRSHYQAGHSGQRGQGGSGQGGSGQGGSGQQPRGGGNQDFSHADVQSYQYCTHKCLLGLVRNTALDKKCPNVSLHRQQDSNLYHPINHDEWLHYLREQFKETLDFGIMPLGKYGARGFLFKITLLRYGYTFVGKGTVDMFAKHIRHEEAVYQRLQNLQGVRIPVLLGSLNLNDIAATYFYDFGVWVRYLMFLSWAGDSVDKVKVSTDMNEKWSKEMGQLLQQLHASGVVHGDVRGANVLWNGNAQSLMLIDFDRAVILKSPRLPLAPISPNKKRPRLKGNQSGGKGVDQPIQNKSQDPQFLAQKDILAATLLFL